MFSHVSLWPNKREEALCMFNQSVLEAMLACFGMFWHVLPWPNVERGLVHVWYGLTWEEVLCYGTHFQPDPIKQWNIFFLKKCEKCRTKKQPKIKSKSKSKKKAKKMQKKAKTMQQKCKKKEKTQNMPKKQNTKAKAKGTYKKQNFKSQSVFGCKSKYLTSCKHIFKLPAASKKNMEQKLIPSILTMIMMWLKINGFNLAWPADPPH